MIVTRLEKIDQKRTKVYINDEYYFLLYPSDLRKYRIEENEEISEQDYHEIVEDTIFRRGKQKALAILKYMDRTESELELKLKQAFYTDEIIERVIEYIKSYHYIDDERYAINYINLKKGSKSKRQIQNELYRKGIDKELLERILEEEYTDEEKTIQKAIQKAMQKKATSITELTFEEKQKLIASLCRKGFAYEDICHYLQ